MAQHPGWQDLTGRTADITGVGYAESDDGIHWTKPPVGFKYSELIDGAPAIDTNVVAQGHGFGCFIDPSVPWGAPDKYKAVFDNHFDFEADGGDINKACLAYSPDGIHWTNYNNGEAVTYRAADTQNQILWNPLIERYMLITREDLAGDVSEGENRGTRVMAHAKGNDLINHPTEWKTLAIIGFNREGEDEWLRRQIHAFTDWIYEGVHFGFISALEYYGADDDAPETPEDLHIRHEKKIVNFYISTSRDGINWDLDWAYAEKPLIPRGPAGSWDKDGIHVPNLITHEDRHWLYYCGMLERFGHDNPKGLMGIGLASLRLDGFVYLEAKDDLGTVVTKPFTLEGNVLQVNVDASNNSEFFVEVLDINNRPIPGFSAREAEIYAGADALRLKPRWKDQSNLSVLNERLVRLKFYLRNAKLYAFQIQ